MLDNPRSIQPNSYDYQCLFTALILITIGVIMIFSTSSIVGFSSFNDSYFFIKRHLVFLGLGFIALFIGAKFPHSNYQKIALPGLVAAIALLLLTLIPGLGIKVGGAHRWLNLGLISIQPVEIAKFFIMVYISTALVNKNRQMAKFGQGIIPIIIILFLPLLILFAQPDLGNSLLIFGIALLLLFLGHMRYVHIIALVFSGFTAGIFSILLNPYQINRLKTFLNPWADPLGKSYHVIQSFIAIGSGGIFGLGIGQSKLKYFYVPLHYSDFIFSIICEEGGFILGVFVLCLYGYLLYRGVIISRNARSPFSYYLGLGITLMLVLQALLNIGVVIGVFPVTGIPLTFISFGGTSLITSMFYVGVLLNISKTNKNHPQKET